MPPPALPPRPASLVDVLSVQVHMPPPLPLRENLQLPVGQCVAPQAPPAPDVLRAPIADVVTRNLTLQDVQGQAGLPPAAPVLEQAPVVEAPPPAAADSGFKLHSNPGFAFLQIIGLAIFAVLYLVFLILVFLLKKFPKCFCKIFCEECSDVCDACCDD